MGWTNSLTKTIFLNFLYARVCKPFWTEKEIKKIKEKL